MSAVERLLVSKLQKVPFVQFLRAREGEGVHDFLVGVSANLYEAEGKIIPIFMAAMRRFPDANIEFMIHLDNDLDPELVESWGPLVFARAASPQ